VLSSKISGSRRQSRAAAACSTRYAAIKTWTPSVDFAEAANDSVTANDLAALAGIAMVPVPTWMPAAFVSQTLRFRPSHASLTPPTVTALISWRLSTVSQPVVYEVVTPSVSQDAAAPLSTPAFVLVMPPRLAAIAWTPPITAHAARRASTFLIACDTQLRISS